MTRFAGQRARETGRKSGQFGGAGRDEEPGAGGVWCESQPQMRSPARRAGHQHPTESTTVTPQGGRHPEDSC